MKTIKYLLFALLATFVLAGCTDDVTYDRGENENPGNYGVYFPTQTTPTEVDLDPTDATKLTYTVRRTTDMDAISVPVVVTATPADVFRIGAIEFAEGQTETVFEVDFPEAEIGVTYDVNIRIEDTRYAPLYGERSTGMDFTVTRAKWNLVVGTGGETTGKWRDDIIGSAFGVTNAGAEKDVEIYEREDRPGYYRIYDLYNAAYIQSLFGRPVGTGFRAVYTIIDATDPDNVWCPIQSTGTTLGNDGEISFGSFCHENYPDYASATNYGTMVDGVITFPINGLILGFANDPGGMYNGNRSGLLRLMLPGAKVYDYSLALSAAEPVDGKVAISAALGTDVATVKYAIFEGALNDAQASLNAIAMDDGDIAFDGEITASGVITAQMEETGRYTLIANVYNEAGAMQDYRFVPFGYVKQGDQMPVVMTVKAELTSQYEAQGITPENSIRAIFYGEEIESGAWGLFKTADLEGLTEAQLAQVAAQSGDPFTAEELEEINGEGFSTMIIGLLGGTDYTLLTTAFNGYYNKLYVVEQATQGDPDPRQVRYMPEDVVGGLDKAALLKTWNYYAVDQFEDANNRVLLGQVTITENTEDDTAEEDYVNVSGLTTLAGGLASGSDAFPVEYYNGMLYTGSGHYFGQVQNYHVTNRFTTEENTSLYNGTGLFIGASVGEGYYAFVPSPSIIAQGLTVTGMYMAAYSGYDAATGTLTGYLGGLAHYKWLLLVDPAIDGDQTAAVTKALSVHPTNYVELRGPALAKALWKEIAGKPANRAVETVRVPMPAAAKAKVNSTFSEGFAGNAANGSEIRFIGVKRN